jgi:hypothetical protein
VGVHDIPSYRKLPILPKWEMLTHFCCLALAQQETNRSKKARAARQNAHFCLRVSRYSARLAFNFYLKVFSQIIQKDLPPQFKIMQV